MLIEQILGGLRRSKLVLLDLLYKKKSMGSTYDTAGPVHLSEFLRGKSEYTLMLFDHFINKLKKIGPVTIHPHKTMISIANSHKRVACITQAGKKFIYVVFPFKERYDDNLCFHRIQVVPGRNTIYHHFRMLQTEDINDEVLEFMRLAYNG